MNTNLFLKPVAQMTDANIYQSGSQSLASVQVDLFCVTAP